MTRTVLITGAATRIGRVIAEGLAADGWSVVVHYSRSQKPAAALVDEIQSAGGRAVAVRANLNVPKDVGSLIEAGTAAIGAPLTALINNASVYNEDSAEAFTPALFDHHIGINLKAPLVLARDFAAQLPDAATGNIINLIDQRVLNPDAEFFTYAVSKSGLYWATKTMAQAFAPRIRVNGIGPGPTLKNHLQSDAEFDEELASTLLEIGSPPESIIHGVRYLLSASSVTGQMIAIDGGQHLSGNAS